jgi:hypothetical protein
LTTSHVTHIARPMMLAMKTTMPMSPRTLATGGG